MRHFRYVPAVSIAISFIALSFTVSGCSSTKPDPFAGVGSPYYSGSGPLPKGGGRYHVGKPYQVAGNWFHPSKQPGYDKVGIASWYGPQFHRRMTSNGEWFDMNELTAAHPTLPLPSYVKVSNLQNGSEVVVRVNDRGPFVGTRIIDMSRRSAEILGFKPQGKAKVRVQYIGPAPLDDQGSHLAAMNQELQRGTPVRRMIASADLEETSGTQIAAAGTSYQPPEYFVQVGSFADPYNAERAREELANSGPVEIQEMMSSAGTLYRVRIGPMPDEGQAAFALQQAVDLGHPDAQLVVANAAL